jgi:hypothetical protein
VNAIAPLIEAGNVYLPDPSIAPWVDAYIEEVCGFPNLQHDDDVDMTTQAIDRLAPAARHARNEAHEQEPDGLRNWRTMMQRRNAQTAKVSTGWGA